MHCSTIVALIVHLFVDAYVFLYVWIHLYVCVCGCLQTMTNNDCGNDIAFYWIYFFLSVSLSVCITHSSPMCNERVLVCCLITIISHHDWGESTKRTLNSNSIKYANNNNNNNAVCLESRIKRCFHINCRCPLHLILVLHHSLILNLSFVVSTNHCRSIDKFRRHEPLKGGRRPRLMSTKLERRISQRSIWKLSRPDNSR